MPPIPIYTQSPISAAKPSGVTPQTAAQSGRPTDAEQPPTTAAPDRSQQGYPAAQPGAAPSLPAPTGTAQLGQHIAEQPTLTTKPEFGGPAPPQPGAVPIAPGSRGVLPPPPKATQAPKLPGNAMGPHASPVPVPPQMSMPTPTVPLSQRGTSTDSASGSGYSAGRGFQQPGEQRHLPTSFTQPSGYYQNISASGLDSNQRAAPDALNYSIRHGGSADADGDEEGVWNSAKKWAQAAGDKLSAAESEVWRRINKS